MTFIVDLCWTPWSIRFSINQTACLMKNSFIDEWGNAWCIGIWASNCDAFIQISHSSPIEIVLMLFFCKRKKMKIKELFVNNTQMSYTIPEGIGHLGSQIPHFPLPTTACLWLSIFVGHHGTPGLESIKLQVLCKIPL